MAKISIPINSVLHFDIWTEELMIDIFWVVTQHRLVDC